MPINEKLKTLSLSENSLRNRALNVEEKTDAIQKPKEKLKLVDKKEPKPVPHWTVQGYGDPKKSVITADNRSKQQREYDDKKTKEWLAAEHKKDIDQKVMNYMLLPAAIGIAQFTPAAPYVNAALFAHGANGLHNQYQNRTLGWNMETVGNTLSMVPFTPKVLKTTGGVAGKVINTVIDSRPMMGLYRNFKPARDWRLGLEFDRTLGHSYSPKMPYLYTESSKITGVPTQSGFSGTPYKMFDPKQLQKDMAFNAQTPGGYQLKSLMRGNYLEKQLSKKGTLKADNILSYAKNKTSPMERQIMEEVLNTKFKGQEYINYVAFKKAVQERLIGPYERIPQSGFADVGMEGLGFKRKPFPERSPGQIFGVEDFMHNSELNKVFPYPVKLNTFTFKSPRIMSLSDVNHYPGNPTGHSRTFVFPTEPHILYVMESQSDWAQNIRKFNQSLSTKKADYTDLLKLAERDYDYYTILSELRNGDQPFIQSNLKHFKQLVEDYKTKLQDLDLYSKQLQDPSIIHLQNNYLQRQLQENLRYAAEQGHTKMRYPTRESAVKIEGYTPAEMPLPREWSDEVLQFAKTNPKSPYTSEIYELSKKLETATDKTKIAEIQSQLKRAKEIEQKWLNGEVTYPLRHETILDKYSGFPDLYNKLFKNQEIKIVTDTKGNTWYEVDVPKNYLNMEWQYKTGGKLIKKQYANT